MYNQQVICGQSAFWGVYFELWIFKYIFYLFFSSRCLLCMFVCMSTNSVLCTSCLSLKSGWSFKFLLSVLMKKSYKATVQNQSFLFFCVANKTGSTLRSHPDWIIVLAPQWIQLFLTMTKTWVWTQVQLALKMPCPCTFSSSYGFIYTRPWICAFTNQLTLRHWSTPHHCYALARRSLHAWLMNRIWGSTLSHTVRSLLVKLSARCDVRLNLVAAWKQVGRRLLLEEVNSLCHKERITQCRITPMPSLLTAQT